MERWLRSLENLRNKQLSQIALCRLHERPQTSLRKSQFPQSDGSPQPTLQDTGYKTIQNPDMIATATSLVHRIRVKRHQIRELFCGLSSIPLQ